jgi:hypothetical protein
MTTTDQANETPFPWEKWEKLPKEEREAEMKEAIKKYQQAEDLRQQIINRGGDPDSPSLDPLHRAILSGASEEGEIDVLTGETADIDAVGNSDKKQIPPFPFWDVVEATTDTEAVGHPRGLFPLPDFTDQLDNTEDISLNPMDNNWAFVNNTGFIPEPEALSPFEFDVAAPLVTDQAVMGDQSKADPSGFCEDLRWVLPEQDLPFGCK